MEEAEISLIDELSGVLNKFDSEEIESSITLSFVEDLVKELDRQGTVRQICDVEDLSEKYNKAFYVLSAAVEFSKDFDALVKILKGYTSNMELDYYKFRLGGNEQTEAD